MIGIHEGMFIFDVVVVDFLYLVLQARTTATADCCGVWRAKSYLQPCTPSLEVYLGNHGPYDFLDR